MFVVLDQSQFFQLELELLKLCPLLRHLEEYIDQGLLMLIDSEH